VAEEERLSRRPGAGLPAIADGHRHRDVPHAARIRCAGDAHERRGADPKGLKVSAVCTRPSCAITIEQLAAAARSAEGDGPCRPDRLAPRPACPGTPTARHRQGGRHTPSGSQWRQDAALHHKGRAVQKIGERSGVKSASFANASVRHQLIENALVVVGENIAANNEPHHLGASCQNPVDARIGEHPADRIFIHKASTAM
jgi:hypothetical protein